MKKLKTINVGYFRNRYAQDIIYEHINDGWGIDSMAQEPHGDNPNGDVWVTFYKYETKESSANVPSEPEQEHTYTK